MYAQEELIMPVNPRVKAGVFYVLHGCIVAWLILAVMAMVSTVRAQSSSDANIQKLNTDDAVNSFHLDTLEKQVNSMDASQLGIKTQLNDINMQLKLLTIESEARKQQFDSLGKGVWTIAVGLFGGLLKFASDAWRERKLQQQRLIKEN